MSKVKFSLALLPGARSPEAKNSIIDRLAENGVEHTGSGLATLSFVAGKDEFENLFQTIIPELPDMEQRPQESVGATGIPPISEPVVPDVLKELVESVSVAPTAQHYR